jgi:hypothetical protein
MADFLKEFREYLEQDSLAWQQYALCAEIDTEPWFPDQLRQGDYAKSICKQCPVKLNCYEYAVENNEEWGIWGGVDFTRRHNKRGKDDDYGYSGEGTRTITIRASEFQRLAEKNRGE